MPTGSIELRWWLLSNLVGIESLQTLYRLLVTVTFTGFLLVSLSPLMVGKGRTSNIQNILLSTWIFVVSLAAFILAARWPGFLPPMLNPDEAQFTAGAMKLLKDPVFWRAVDAGSTGPLNVYLLTLPAFFALKVEYASVRVIGLIVMSTAISCLYYALDSVYGKAISRLATIPVVTTIALMTFYDFVHYTSEHLPIALLSVALLIVCKYFAGNLSHPDRVIFSLGFVLGLIPYAKMQAIPIAFSISCIFLHLLWLRSKTRGEFLRNLYPFVLGALLFSVLVILYLTMFSLYEVFWKAYIQQNLLFYSSQSLHGAEDANVTLRQQFIVFVKLIITGPKDTRFLFGLTAIILLTGTPFLIRKRGYLNPNKSQPDTFIFVYYSLAFLAASIYSIVKPGNLFEHYLLFLIVPSGFLIGVFLGEIEKFLQSPELTRQNLKLSFLTVAVATIVASSCLQVVTSVKAGNDYIRHRRHYAENYGSPLAKTILKYASAGELMAIWGWTPTLYVDTGLIQATRDGASVWQIKPGPLQDYFVKRYAGDLLKSNASLFVDAVAPGMFFFQDRQRQGHEVFPEIANIIKNNYKFVDEVGGVRLYLKTR